MLQKADVDAVIISTSHHLYYPMAVEAMRAGKHVLVDKSMATNLKEADDMVKEAERRHLKLGVNLQYRLDPAFCKIRAPSEQGRFGRLILGEAIVEWHRPDEYYGKSSWRGRWATEGGGASINQVTHTIDLLLWIWARPNMCGFRLTHSHTE